jgi:hypothetical protein
MKRLLSAMTLAGCLLCFFPVLAAAGNSIGDAERPGESWYTYWGIGWSSNTYPHEVEKILDSAKRAGFDSVSASVDALGFYWPLPNNPKTLLGVVVNGAADYYWKGSDNVQISSYLLGLSSMHFFGPEPGRGFFIRADFGMAWYDMGSDISSENSNLGYGGLIGGGYGIPISAGTRILLNVNYAMRHVDGDNAGSFGISVGGLW